MQKIAKIFKNRANNGSNMQFYPKNLWVKSSPTLGAVGSNPIGYTKNSTSFDLSNFLSIAKAMAYHRALACISSPKVYIINRRLYYFRNDDIQDCVLMICNALH